MTLKLKDATVLKLSFSSTINPKPADCVAKPLKVKRDKQDNDAAMTLLVGVGCSLKKLPRVIRPDS